jgi:hypothetical protein
MCRVVCVSVCPDAGQLSVRLDSVEYVEFVLKYPSPVGIFWDLLEYFGISETPDFSKIVTDFVVSCAGGDCIGCTHTSCLKQFEVRNDRS